MPATHCQLCGRAKPLTFHHFVPKTCHSNKWFRKNFARAEMKAQGIHLCDDCHHFIHEQFPEKDLGRLYNTEEKLRQQPSVTKYLAWARKQK